MSTYRKLTTFAAVAALGFGLAACGGGGGGDTADNGGPPVVTPDPAIEAKALADAQAAAKSAWQAARDALAGITGKEGANPTAHQRAVNAVADAKAAYDDAAEAMTSTVAKRHQGEAETARDMAQEQVALVIASYEAPALERAQMAAKSAADAAMKAYEAAKKAVMDVESIKDSDTASYDTAVAKRDAAKQASDDANAAYMAAKATKVLKDAEDQQKAAEDALETANTANSDAMKYAGMVQTAENTALMNAKNAAQDAYDRAKEAYDTVKARVEALADKREHDPDNETRARDGLAEVKQAYDAAAAANVLAQAATTSKAAKMHQGEVETQQALVDTRKMKVDMYAGAVELAYMQNTEEDRLLSEAKDGAKKAADAARKAATDAAGAAQAVVDVLGPNAQASIDALAAAAAADTAAGKAEDANTAAQAADNSGDAQEQRRIAEAEQKNAEDELAKVRELAREAGIVGAGLDQLRIEGIRTQAKAASDAAAESSTMADEKARMARAEATSARDAADKAMRARTDYETAGDEATEAETAATDAEADAQAASDAAAAAMAEYEKTKAEDVTVDAARAALAEAQKQRDIAGQANTDAMGEYETAMAAHEDAVEAADVHVIQLFIMADAQHITTAADPLANTDETEAQLIVRNQNLHRANVNTAVADAADDTGDTVTGNTQVATTVAATWPHANPDDTTTVSTETTPRDGQLTVTVSIDGTAVPFTRDTATTPADESTFRAAHGGGLGAFQHGLEIWQETDDGATPPVRTGGTRILVFTDKEQASAPIDAKSVSLTNEPVSMASRVTPTEAPATTGDDIHDFAGTYDHDGNPATTAITGTFDCVDPATCQVTRSGTGNNGEHVAGQTTVTSISGYRFTGTGTTAAVLAMEDNTYLAFGIWLRETVVADSTDTYQFGAFAGGGNDYDSAATNGGEVAAITGTASYEGDAAGIHATADRMDFFSAKATLNADFGDGTALGTITGMIHDIVSGGDAMDDVIHMELNDIDAASANAANIVAGSGDDQATFGGRTRLGPATQRLDREFDYEFEGTWQGRFFNQVLDDTATTTVTESTQPPGSVAGTFGVTKADDATTMDVNEMESYVGAFGAHKQ